MKRTLLFAAAVLLVACSNSTTLPLAASPQTPAAQGNVEAKTGSNNNTELDVRVEKLADPDRVAPGTSTYVVWAKADDGQTQNLGALRVGKDNHGELSTVTSLKHFQLIITPEASAQAAAPSQAPVFTARVDR